jgi:hypothetical protein
MKGIGEINAEAEQAIDKMRMLIHLHAQEYIMLCRFLESLVRPNDSCGTYAGLGYSGGSIAGVYVQVHLEKEESFKVAEPIIAFLLDRGWTVSGQTETAEGDYWSFREVTFQKPSDPPLFPSARDPKIPTLTATIRMWPHKESAVCKRVEDGVVPKYKLVCEGA